MEKELSVQVMYYWAGPMKLIRVRLGLQQMEVMLVIIHWDLAIRYRLVDPRCMRLGLRPREISRARLQSLSERMALFRMNPQFRMPTINI